MNPDSEQRSAAFIKEKETTEGPRGMPPPKHRAVSCSDNADFTHLENPQEGTRLIVDHVLEYCLVNSVRKAYRIYSTMDGWGSLNRRDKSTLLLFPFAAPTMIRCGAILIIRDWRLLQRLLSRWRGLEMNPDAVNQARVSLMDAEANGAHHGAYVG
ncbi:uncharacterized protein PG998_014917 [Apiospora kogelbergensis]|uniref:uncharacterized protein n=1 Tax=Apiospora kogelbergensis TaxID=1337665 RepID=UPI003130D733